MCVKHKLTIVVKHTRKIVNQCLTIIVRFLTNIVNLCLTNVVNYVFNPKTTFMQYDYLFIIFLSMLLGAYIWYLHHIHVLDGLDIKPVSHQGQHFVT